MLRNKLNQVRESIREKHLAKEKAEADTLLKLQEEKSSAGTGRDSKMKGKGKKKK